MSRRHAEKSLIEAAAVLGVRVEAGEPLARHTTFRIGGPADLYAVASNITQLERLAGLARDYGLRTMVLGGGSNILVADDGFRGLVIANQARTFEFRPGQVVADSGVALAGLARSATRAGMSGLEWAVSMPGTLGGAIVGNAGAHGGAISDNLAWALLAWPGQTSEVMHREDLGLAYRSSSLKSLLQAEEQAPVVLQLAFDMIHGDVAEMNHRASTFLAKRRASQPVEPSAGSIFRNPPGGIAGQLIEAAGLKGRRIGDACVSPRHANFIVNLGAARATDVAELIDLVRCRVKEHSGILLTPEILFVGDWPALPPYRVLGE